MLDRANLGNGSIMLDHDKCLALEHAVEHSVGISLHFLNRNVHVE